MGMVSEPVPHELAGRTHLVTLYLVDSIPWPVLDQWQRELVGADLEVARQQLPLRIERYLNSGHGACELSRPEVAEVVRAAVLAGAGESYDLRSWVIMPNHVHLILRWRPGHLLAPTIERLKADSAAAANPLLGRSGPFWARETFVEDVAEGEALAQAVEYVRANPVAAGLCATAEDWPWAGREEPA